MRVKTHPLAIMTVLCLALTAIAPARGAQSPQDASETDAAAALAALEQIYQEAKQERFAAGPALERLEQGATALIERVRGSASPAMLATARTYLLRCWLTAAKNEQVFDETTALLATDGLKTEDRIKLLYYRGSSAVALDRQETAQGAVDELYRLKPETAAAVQSMIAREWKTVEPGKPAPGWRLPCLHGDEAESAEQALALEDLRGKYVLLDFWATWCGPCRQVMAKDLQPLQVEWGGHPRFALVGVGTNWRSDTAEKQAEFATQNDYHWVKVFDADGFVAARYGVQSIPTLTLIDPEGKVVAHGPAAVVMPVVRETLARLGPGA